MKFTQEKFAVENHINVARYGAIERGTQNVTRLSLGRIADTLGRPMSQLIRGAESWIEVGAWSTCWICSEL